MDREVRARMEEASDILVPYCSQRYTNISIMLALMHSHHSIIIFAFSNIYKKMAAKEILKKELTCNHQLNFQVGKWRSLAENVLA